MEKDILRFTSHGSNIEDSLLIGNGKLGAIIHGGGEKEVISLNIDSLWSRTAKLNHNTKGHAMMGRILEMMRSDGDIRQAHHLVQKCILGGDAAAFMPLADLTIEHIGADLRGFERILDMSKGVVTSTYGNTSRTYYANHPHNVIVVRYEGADLNIRVRLGTKHLHSQTKLDEGVYLSGYAPKYTSTRIFKRYKRGIYMGAKDVIKYYCGVTALSDGRLEYDKGIVVSNANYVELRFTADTSYDHPNTSTVNVKSALDNLRATDYGELLREHIEDFQALYNRCSLELGDCDYSHTTDEELKGMEIDDDNLAPVVKLFNLGRYLMISGSREGTEALNLQGIWQDSLSPPWSSNYTTNINLQMNYWACEQVGLSECVKPLLGQIEKMVKWGRYTARDSYGGNGWVSGHNSDIWGHASPTCGNFKTNACHYAQFYGCSGWLCLHLFEHYEYTCDKDYLRNFAYPIMKEAAQFYIGMLIEVDGKLVLSPGASPENMYMIDGKRFALVNGTTMDMSIVKQLFLDIKRSADILNLDDEILPKIDEMLPRIKPFSIGSHGQLLEWDKEYLESEPNHRHMSHLYGNHPAHLIDSTTPELQAAVRQSLADRGDEGTGWSIAWKINHFARLHDGEHAYSLVKRHLKPCVNNAKYGGGTYPNYLCAHPPFQIDGNFGVMSGISEMLMQSSIERIHLLPALPKRMHSGKVTGMRAKGGWTVDFAWDTDNVTVTVYGKEGGNAKIAYGGNEYSAICGETLTIKREQTSV